MYVVFVCDSTVNVTKLPLPLPLLVIIGRGHREEIQNGLASERLKYASPEVIPDARNRIEENATWGKGNRSSFSFFPTRAELGPTQSSLSTSTSTSTSPFTRPFLSSSSSSQFHPSKWSSSLQKLSSKHMPCSL